MKNKKVKTEENMRKTALVTGGNHGIGNGIIRELAKHDYDIVFSYYPEDCRETAEQIAEELSRENGIQCTCCYAALQNHDHSAKMLFDYAVSCLSEISLVVNNAGVTIFEDVDKLTEENLDHLLNLDFRTYMLMMSYASQHMIEKGIKGSIINITSSRAERAYPSDGIYGAVKAGIKRAVESFALDVAPYGIRINCVAPGAIQCRSQEEMIAAGKDPEFYPQLGARIPLGRNGRPDDIGKAIVFLASEEASYITGITIRVDGGLILPGMPEAVRENMNAWGKTVK